MKLAINGATTMPYTLEEDIIAAAKAGFDSIEIWYGKLQEYLKTKPIEQLKELLEETKLEVAALCPTYVRAFSNKEGALEEYRRAAEIARYLGCETLLTCSERPEGITKSDAIKRFSLVAKQYVEIAEDYGLKCALEPAGRHPFLDGPTVALEIMSAVNLPNLGLMLDTFHYYKSDVTMEEIENIPVDKLYIIHINDCEDLPKPELQDKDRLYPTLGVIPAVDMLKPIVKKGYSGAFSVEIFRPAYWETPIDEINRNAYETGKKLVSLVQNQ